VNTGKTISIGDNQIPKHFLSKERTCAKKEYILLVNLFFLRKGFSISLVKLSFPKKGLYA